jgi:ABC-type phosphate transport system ATPase subunit
MKFRGVFKEPDAFVFTVNKNVCCTIKTEAANSSKSMADILSTTRRHMAQHRILVISIGTSR